MGNPKLKIPLSAIIFIFVLAGIIIVFYSGNNLVEALRVPNEDMRPALMRGDAVFINKAAYRKSAPLRGDVIAFHCPYDSKKISIQRIAGLSKEALEIKEGRLVINKRIIQQPEALAKIHYLNSGDYGREGQTVMVAGNNYYVLGDNSAASRDSRHWGFVPREYIIGRVARIYLPLGRLMHSK